MNKRLLPMLPLPVLWAVMGVRAYESFPVADFFAECGGQRQLPYWSYDVASHPNDIGTQIMANVLIQAFEKILDGE